jgi:RsiW-degrading membrane proteinase PrsW (M82 family)
MGLLALSIAPGFAICIYIYFKDKYKREPVGLLLVSFVLGMISIIPAILMELPFGEPMKQLAGKPIKQVAFYAFVVVGFSEEISKYIMVRLFAFKRTAFDDPFDGIVYTVMVGMGFATLENIGYVYENGMATGIVRMFLSVPAHATFAVLMGYHIGLAKFDPQHKTRHLLYAILWPVLFHGAFDFFLFKGNTILHVAGAFASFIIAIKLSRKAIRKKLLLSKSFSEGIDDFTGQDHSLL